MEKNIILQRLKGLVYKEILQIFRDPSSLLIAFVLPAIFLVLCGYGLSLDIKDIKFGIVTENTTPTTQSLVRSFINSKYYDVSVGYDRHTFEKELIAGKIKGFLVISQDFSQKIKNKNNFTPIQLITDGSDSNTAILVQNYTQGLLYNWLGQNYAAKLISVEPRIWFNSELKSSNSIIPGIIAIAMTLVGTLLTSLVVAREWERGTMESLMATPVSIVEIILGKIIPYFILGMISAILVVVASILMFDLPFRGSFVWLLILSAAFMLVSLFLGLLISTLSKNQFVASVVSLVIAFLPTVMLSGFMFEISSMPLVIRLISYVIPAQYFVSGVRSLFLAGDIPELFILDTVKMLLFGLAVFFIIAKKTVKRLD